MAAPTIADYLKYASLQMAAEAFLKEKDPDTGNWIKRYSERPLITALTRGNRRNSRFTESEAEKFSKDWKVLDQLPNTPTGFSGTLFYNTKTFEYVISFRSTEFIDDAIRDSASTNTMEVHDTGWAWGQITDMEAWYAGLRQSRLLPPGTKPAVTGYSLGGHLATTFNLPHRSEIGQIDVSGGAGNDFIFAGHAGMLASATVA
jgi:hypothetical protein